MIMITERKATRTTTATVTVMGTPKKMATHMVMVTGTLMRVATTITDMVTVMVKRRSARPNWTEPPNPEEK